MKQDIDYYAIKDFQPSKPVCIDLDGTFVRYHALWYLKGYFSIELMSFPQAFLRAVHDFLGPKNAPVWQESENTSDSLSFLCVHCKSLWSAFKWHLSTRQCTDVSNMDYRFDLIKCMMRWKAMGVSLYLVTGSPMPLAQKVYHHYSGLFDGFLSSSPTVNLVGAKKAAALVHRWGVEGFHYVGDGWADRHVWSVSKDILTVVSPSHVLFKKILKSKRHDQSLYTLI